MKSMLRRIVIGILLAVLAAVLWFAVPAWSTARSMKEDAARFARGEGATPSQLPRKWIDQLLAVEDPAFYTHHGVDLRTPGAGWTTLTQGLVKIHFPGPHRGLAGKPVQTLRALILDCVVSKEDQLTLLLNTAYFGEGPSGAVIGFDQAAEVYYGRKLPELSDAQYLGLVAMLIGPNNFHPIRRPDRHRERLRRIQALVEGRCKPADWEDVYLTRCGDQKPAVQP